LPKFPFFFFSLFFLSSLFDVVGCLGPPQTARGGVGIPFLSGDSSPAALLGPCPGLPVPPFPWASTLSSWRFCSGAVPSFNDAKQIVCPCCLHHWPSVNAGLQTGKKIEVLLRPPLFFALRVQVRFSFCPPFAFVLVRKVVFFFVGRFPLGASVFMIWGGTSFFFLLFPPSFFFG